MSAGTSDYTKCRAYDNLEKTIGKQCKNYYQFHPQGAFGSMPGMYVPSHVAEEIIPADLTRGYFRGGIISTIATFEGFVTDLIKEASEVITKDNASHVRGDAESAAALKKRRFESRLEQFREKKRKQTKAETPILYHTWEDKYTDLLLRDNCDGKPYMSFTDRMLAQGVMQYDYPIGSMSNQRISRISITHKCKEMTQEDKRTQRLYQRLKLRSVEGNRLFEDESFICAFIRLLYGIRCVMAHGDPTISLDDGVLKNFPDCPKCCGNKTHNDLRKIMDLVVYIQQYEEHCSNEAERRELDTLDVLRIPKKDKFLELRKFDENNRILSDKEWEDAIGIVDDCFPDSSTTAEWHPNFAYFHICRVYCWLKKNQSNMYITYRLLVRANQFIHMLAFRMYLATATILINDYSVPFGETGEFWGVSGKNPQDIKKKIERFTMQHQNFMFKVQDDGNSRNTNDQQTKETHRSIAMKSIESGKITENKWNISICESVKGSVTLYSYVAIFMTTDAKKNEIPPETDKPIQKFKQNLDDVTHQKLNDDIK